MNFIAGQLICVSIFLLPFAMSICERRPQGATGERSVINDKFQIYIEGNPTSYLPGNTYNISLECDKSLSFLTFTLAVESEDPFLMYQSGHDTLGRFELLDIAETKFSLQCENMVENANTNKKSRIVVAWTAPTNNASECILFRAGLVQNRYVWFIDDGFLTKRFCPEEIDAINSQTPPLETCCACDEAKYEIILERKWSRNTHPKDFPEQSWRTRFSELIGASHTNEYTFWEYGKLASEGLQALAEHGATSGLETEIKQNISDGSIRTIIKAPGIQLRYNSLGSTLANVRVDPIHHRISVVSKIVPSPDWIIGVSGMELCLVNCTWIDSKVLNLYPWDVGTDSGPSYMSADEPQVPPDVIRRISSTSPSDVRSPFFDKTGQQMKPIATLYVMKRKIYERKCENEGDEDAENQALECATHPWNNWSECSKRCGNGIQRRVRVYKDQSLADNYHCGAELEQEQNCEGTDCSGSEIEGEEPSPYDTNESAECALSPWSDWSPCSKSCGIGFTRRTKEYLKPYAADSCQKRSYVKLEETKSCFINRCLGSLDENDNNGNEEVIESNNQYNKNYKRPQSGRWNTDESDDQDNKNYRRPQSGGRWDEKTDDVTGEEEQYNTNYERTQSGRFGKARNQVYGEREDSQYKKNNYDGTSSMNENEDETQPGYGTNMFSGEIQRTRGRNNMGLSDSNNKFNQNPNRNRFPTRPNSRIPTPTNAPPRTPYAGMSNPYDERNSPQSMGSFDEENNEPGDDTHVQEFCLTKPYSMDTTCDFKEIVTKNYWLYDADDGECKLFTSDNCDKNENKFNTLEKCEEVCLTPHQNQLRAQHGGFNEEDIDGYNPYGRERGFGVAQSQIKASTNYRDYAPKRQTGAYNRRRIF